MKTENTIGIGIGVFAAAVLVILMTMGTLQFIWNYPVCNYTCPTCPQCPMCPQCPQSPDCEVCEVCTEYPFERARDYAYSVYRYDKVGDMAGELINQGYIETTTLLGTVNATRTKWIKMVVYFNPKNGEILEPREYYKYFMPD